MGTGSNSTGGYALGIDLGTTFTAAAVATPGQLAVAVPLGSRADTMPSVLHLSSGSGFLVGDAAERRALVDPDHVVRRFKRRIGDETPLLIGADAYHAHTLAAKLIAWVNAHVTQRQGREPNEIAVTHPASWGPHKRELLARALAEVGLSRARLISEPAAAAYAYAHSGRLTAAGALAVYDLGGGTFDACVMRAGADGQFAVVGIPSGLPNLGGIDFDDAVLDHVLDGLGAAKTALDPADPMVVTALARLRRECVDAKEALSTDTTATIPVLLGELATSVRITRAEFEELIAPGVASSIDALESALDSADLEPGELKRLLLTGGSSRIPLVVQSLSARLGPGVQLDRGLDPKLAVAMGAALSALRSVPAPASSVPAARTAAEATESMDENEETGTAGRPEADAPPRPDATVPASPVLVVDPPRQRRHRALFLLATATMAMVAGTFGQHYLQTPHRSAASPVQAHPAAPAPAAAPAAPTPAAPAVPAQPAAPTAAPANPPAITVAVPTQARAPERSTGRNAATAVGPRRVVVIPGPGRPARPQGVVQRPAYPVVDPRPDSGWTSWSPAAPAPAAVAPAPAQQHTQPVAPAAPAPAPAAPAPAPDSTDSGSTEFRSSPNGSGSSPNASVRP
ncbi:MAG TPA: Hsp70 family protein [Sporichthyaceae bacterium]|jgi:actin-like ATPase involved in cell morphogenesis|nr:Hsp70 family protein [Sporichthyaceae bacterium]